MPEEESDMAERMDDRKDLDGAVRRDNEPVDGDRGVIVKQIRFFFIHERFWNTLQRSDPTEQGHKNDVANSLRYKN